MKRLFASAIIILSLLFPGCGPSAEQRANQTVESLAEQAENFYEAGLIDEAEECAKRAIATPEATDTEKARNLKKKIERLKYERAWKKAETELKPAFDEVVELLEADKGDEVVALVDRIVAASSGVKADCAKQLFAPLRASLDVSRAASFWGDYDLVQLQRFAESNTLPESIWIDQWGPRPEDPVALATWKKTLAKTLPNAVERKQIEAAQAVPQSPPESFDTNVTVPMEEVSDHPEKWYGKRIYFNNVWVRGGIRRDPEFGYTVSVLSPNGNPFPAKVTGEKMIFVMQRETAEDLNKLVSADSKIEVKMYVKIERSKIIVFEGQRMFPKASVYWVGVLSEGKVQKILRWR